MLTSQDWPVQTLRTFVEMYGRTSSSWMPVRMTIRSLDCYSVWIWSMQGLRPFQLFVVQVQSRNPNQGTGSLLGSMKLDGLF